MPNAQCEIYSKPIIIYSKFKHLNFWENSGLTHILILNV